MRYIWIAVFLLLGVEASIAHDLKDFDKVRGESLCELPAIKNDFKSFEEKKLYDKKIERANRCVVFVVEQNILKIHELKNLIRELEEQNNNTKKNWNDFLDRKGDLK